MPTKEWGPAMEPDRERWVASLKGRDLRTMRNLEVMQSLTEKPVPEHTPEFC